MNTSNRNLQIAALILAALAFLLALAALIFALRSSASRGGSAADQPGQAAHTEQADADRTPEPDDTKTPELPAPTPSATRAEDVQDALDAFITANSGTWDLYYESLSTGAFAAAQSNHGAEHRSVAASLIKLFVMGAVYDAVAEGTLSHDSVYPYLQRMITISDNSACNTLVTMLGSGSADAGIAAVNRYAQSIGCTDTQMNRLMQQDMERNNYVTASDCATILRLIYHGKCVSANASAEMLALLKEQTVDNRIPANLPDAAATAHKTGDLPNLSCGDVGIVFSPAGDYILCAINNYSANDAQTISAIATLSRTVYDVVNK